MSRISQRIIERVHLGEATAAERERVLADPEARAILESLPAQDRAFLAAWPAERIVPQIEAKVRIARAREAQATNRSPNGLLFLAPVLAGILAILVVVAQPGEAPDTLLEETTAKGLAPSLKLYLPSADGPIPLAADATLHAGDVIQVGWQAGDATHGVIVSIDGGGSVTLHFPQRPGDPTVLPTGEQHTDHAFQLDDAPAYERFFLVTGQEPIDTATVVTAAETLARGDARTGDLPLDASLRQTSQLVRKEAP
jgi:hypothetical protein